MEIRVRYFAALTDRTGCREETLRLEPGTDVTGLWQLLLGRHPALRALGFRPLPVCDLEWAEWNRRLDGVREVAFLPPVSGG